MRRSLKQAYANEKGVILPIVAVFGVTLISALILLAVDSHRVKLAQAIARGINESICGYAAQSLPISAAAISSAFGQLSEHDADSSQSGIQLKSWASVTSFTAVTPSIVGPGFGPVAMTSVGAPSCPSGVSCYLQGAVADGSPIAAKFPTNFWTQNSHGAQLACEIEVEVDTFLSGTKPATAKVAYGKALEGNTTPNGTPRGITIGIAPEFEAFDERFEFGPGFDSYNPLDDYDNSGTPSSGNYSFGWARPSVQIDPLDPTSPSLAGSPALQSGGISPQMRYRALRRCLNPYLGMRNTILQAVVGRLARNNMRFNTQLVLVNPLEGGGNLPTVMVQAGQDLLLGGYSLPFVNFRSTSHGATPVNTNGYLSPITGSTNPPIEQHQMLITSQLRDCLIVSNATNGASPELDPTLSNAGLEPPGAAGLAHVLSDYDDSNPAASKQWEGGPGTSLRAVELMSTLANVEECPVRHNGNIQGQNLNNSCTIMDKASDFTNTYPNPQGMRGDIVSFLNYALTGGQGFSALGPLPDPVTGAFVGPLVNSPSNSDHILLLLSKPLTTAEVTAIRATVQNNFVNSAIPDPERRLIVVYMPIHSFDADPQYLTDLRTAFVDNGDTRRVIALQPPADQLSNPQADAATFNQYWLQGVNPVEVAQNILQLLFKSQVAL